MFPPAVLRLLRQVSLPLLRTSWGRTSLVVGGVAAGVALIVAIAMINRSILATLTETVDLVAGPAALEITTGFGELAFDEEVATTVRADPDVVAAVPLVRGIVAFVGDPTTPLQLFGVDLTAEDDLARYGLTTGDRRSIIRALDDPRSLLLTATFSAAHDLAVGRTVGIATPTGIHELTIRGLLATRGVASALDGKLAVMDLPAAQQLLSAPGRIHQVDVVLRPGADAAIVAQRLQAGLGSAFSVHRPEQRGAQYEHMLAAFQAMLGGVSALCLVAGLFLIYNTTATAAVQRTAVMSALRLVGAQPGTLIRLLLAEALIAGVLGAILGVAFGIGLAHLLVGMVAGSMGVIFQLPFTLDRLRASLGQQATIGIIGVVTAVLASSVAAVRSARTEPLHLLRREETAGPSPSGSARLVLAWFAMLVIAGIGLVLQTTRKSFLWGNFGSTVWNASVLVIAVPVVGWAAGAARRLLPRPLGLEGRLATESILRSRTRAGVTVAALALVLTVGVTVSTLAASFRYSVSSYSTAGGFLQGDLVVSSATTMGGWLETPLPPEVGDAIRRVAGVRHVEAWRVLFGQRYRGERLAFFAPDDSYLDPRRIGQRWYREGDATRAAAALRRGDGVAVSVGLADRFDLRLGDDLTLDSPTGTVRLPIVGIVRDYLSDRGAVLLSRRLLRERWHEAGASRFHVFVADGVPVDTVRDRIAETLRDRYLVKILRLAEVIAYQAAAIDRAFAFTAAIQLLIGIVAVVGIFDLLLATISERRRELALWRLIGATESMLQRSVVMEAAAIGVLAALLGVVVGGVTAAIWIRWNFPALLGFHLEYTVPWKAIGGSVLLTVTTALLSGRLAAGDATRPAIVESLRPE